MKEDCNILIIGLGPGGIGAAQVLAKSEHLHKVICIESGGKVENRICPVLSFSNCVEKNSCNIITGFGGASLKAGGKLSLYPAGRALSTIIDSEKLVEEELINSKKIYANQLTLSNPNNDKSSITIAQDYYKSKGFDFNYYDSFLYSQSNFFNANKYFQDELLDSKLRIFFNTKALAIRKEDKFHVECGSRGKKIEIITEKIILAVGRYGKNLLYNLNEGLKLKGKPNKLDIGIRIEFPSNLFSKINFYHNDLKLKTENCKTFCVSKGGKIALYYLDGKLFTEGYEDYLNPTDFTNLSLIFRLPPAKKNLEIYKQLISKLINSGYRNPIRQSYKDFMMNIKSSSLTSSCTINCWKYGDINEFLPKSIAQALKNDLIKFIDTFIEPSGHDYVNLFFPEVNYGGLFYSIGKDFSIDKNIYTIGECTGLFLGILQSHASGRICAERILKNYYEGR